MQINNFTVMNPSKDDEEGCVITFTDPKPKANIPTQIFITKAGETEPMPLCIDRQQLGELGALFLFLAGEFDYDSVGELLDGFEYNCDAFRKRLLKLAKTLD